MLRQLITPALAFALALPSASAAEPVPEILRLRAVAVSINTKARATSLDIVIERWSTPEEVAALKSVLQNQGADKLLGALQRIRPRCGYIRRPATLAWDVYYAREEALPDGGRRILLGTDRPQSQWEIMNHPRSEEFAFSLAEIRLGADGKGEGKTIPAARVSIDPKTGSLQIDNYQIQPNRLNQVQVVAPEGKK